MLATEVHFDIYDRSGRKTVTLHVHHIPRVGEYVEIENHSIDISGRVSNVSYFYNAFFASEIRVTIQPSD